MNIEYKSCEDFGLKDCYNCKENKNFNRAYYYATNCIIFKYGFDIKNNLSHKIKFYMINKIKTSNIDDLMKFKMAVKYYYPEHLEMFDKLLLLK